jgi:hypothetical protein
LKKNKPQVVVSKENAKIPLLRQQLDVSMLLFFERKKKNTLRKTRNKKNKQTNKRQTDNNPRKKEQTNKQTKIHNKQQNKTRKKSTSLPNMSEE